MRIVDVARCWRRKVDVSSKNNYTGYITPTGCVVRYGEHWWEVWLVPGTRGGALNGDRMKEDLREEFQAWIQLLR
jgi:hypothetical protein